MVISAALIQLCLLHSQTLSMRNFSFFYHRFFFLFNFIFLFPPTFIFLPSPSSFLPSPTLSFFHFLSTPFYFIIQLVSLKDNNWWYIVSWWQRLLWLVWEKVSHYLAQAFCHVVCLHNCKLLVSLFILLILYLSIYLFLGLFICERGLPSDWFEESGYAAQVEQALFPFGI